MSKGLDQIALLPYLLYVFGQTSLNKQCRPDEMPQNVASHQGLHCLPPIQQFLDTTLGSKLYLNFRISMVRSWGVDSNTWLVLVFTICMYYHISRVDRKTIASQTVVFPNT